MKNKKLLVAAASTALVAVVGIGATLAYFTDSDDATNVVTMGHVDIDLTETSEDGKATSITDDGITFDNVMPGDDISKVPTITLEDGSRDAWIRMQMSVVPTETNGISQDKLYELESLLRADIVDGGDWYYSEADGYYYYNQPLANTEGGIKSVDFFENVHIPEGWTNNDAADKSFQIILTAQAIQEENVNPTMNGDLVTGWPTAEITEYTASAARE